MTFTKNDARVLEEIRRASGEWDGYVPHGQADWIAIRRLVNAGLVEHVGDGACCTCSESHDAQIFRLVAEKKTVRHD